MGANISASLHFHFFLLNASMKPEIFKIFIIGKSKKRRRLFSFWIYFVCEYILRYFSFHSINVKSKLMDFLLFKETVSKKELTRYEQHFNIFFFLFFDFYRQEGSTNGLQSISGLFPPSSIFFFFRWKEVTLRFMVSNKREWQCY